MFRHLLFNSIGLLPVALAGAALAVAYAFWQYFRRDNQPNGKIGVTLLLLRVFALAVLAISIIRPVVVRRRTSAEQGAIVLLVDRSKSMSVVDINQTPGQLVSLADGLHLLPENIRHKTDANLDGAADAIRNIVNDAYLARGQMDYARIADQSDDDAAAAMIDLSARAQQLADQLTGHLRAAAAAQRLVTLLRQTDLRADEWTSEINAVNTEFLAAISDARNSSDAELYQANPQVRDACNRIASLTRLGIVKQFLFSPKTGVLKQLIDQAPVFGFTFAENVAPLPLEDDRGAVQSLPLVADGLESHLADAIRAVNDAMTSQPVQAFVIFSDGRENGRAESAGRDLSTLKAPVFTVYCAHPVLKDLAISDVRIPKTAYRGQTVVVHADIRQTGYAGESISVELNADGRQFVQQVRVVENRPAVAEFSIQFDRPGRQQAVVAITAQPGETTAGNNRVEREIEVRPEKMKVLAATSWPGWDFQIIQRILEQTPFIDAHVEILTGDAARMQATPAEILQQNIILLSDISPDTLSPDQRRAISQAIEKGNNLIFIPGDPKALEQLVRDPILEKLLPFNDSRDAAWRVWPGDEPNFQFVLAPETAGLEEHDAELLNDMRQWENLPGIFRFMQLSAIRKGVRPILVERDSELPLLTEAHVGAGKVFFFGAREAWRWRDLSGRHKPDRFWLQLLCDAVRPADQSDQGDPKQQQLLEEMSTIAGDESQLRRISAATGGELLPVEEAAELPTKIHAAGETLPGFFEYPIWNSAYLFWFVVGCLGTEWSLRKRIGLL